VVAERFRREAISVAQLSHPNIVAVYDAIEEQIGGERRQAVVMQLVNGKSLRQLLDEQKRLSPDLTMHIGACVASALDCAHRANLVHRDVKPGNILITPDGRVLLTDFGIAKGLSGGVDDDLTSPNVMMGTAKYLSPEQVRGRKLDGRADLYSLGLVLYECLAGRVPFLGETDADTALARLNRDPTDLTRLRPTLPLGLAPLIHRLLARRPDDRYTSGGEVRAELQRIAAQPKTDVDHTEPNVARRTGTTTAQSPATPSGTPRMPRTATAPNARTTGSQAAVKPGRPAGAAVRADRTPTSPIRPRQQPNRKFQHRNGPSMLVVGGLLCAALVVGVVLYITMGNDSGKGLTVPSTQAVAPSTVAPTAAPPTAVGIAKVTVFDPAGDNHENDELAPLAIDGNSTTAWNTVCYGNRFLGGKEGVGLVADLGASRTGLLTVDVGSAPYQVRVYAVAGNTAPTTYAGWGQPIKSFNGTAPAILPVQVTQASRFVLVSFAQLGTNNDCTKNRFRGSIRELTFG
jgi:eukaryotic-like serine/threonine-protein kinase